jgi:hypothetical protein
MEPHLLLAHGLARALARDGHVASLHAAGRAGVLLDVAARGGRVAARVRARADALPLRPGACAALVIDATGACSAVRSAACEEAWRILGHDGSLVVGGEPPGSETMSLRRMFPYVAVYRVDVQDSAAASFAGGSGRSPRTLAVRRRGLARPDEAAAVVYVAAHRARSLPERVALEGRWPSDAAPADVEVETLVTTPGGLVRDTGQREVEPAETLRAATGSAPWGGDHHATEGADGQAGAAPSDEALARAADESVARQLAAAFARLDDRLDEVAALEASLAAEKARSAELSARLAEARDENEATREVGARAEAKVADARRRADVLRALGARALDVARRRARLEDLAVGLLERIHAASRRL